MKHLIVIGAGTAGTTVANQMRNRLPSDWSLTVIDPEPQHVFQPDLIFVPFGMQTPERTLHPAYAAKGRGGGRRQQPDHAE